MKISALIFHLENMKRFFGDVEVRVNVATPPHGIVRTFEVGRPMRPVNEYPEAIKLSLKELK